jgi:hypothetical protein
MGKLPTAIETAEGGNSTEDSLGPVNLVAGVVEI